MDDEYHVGWFVSFFLGIFKSLQSLETLDVAHNELARLVPTYFSDLGRLVTVNASHNAISDYPQGIFARNSVLRVVNLRSNRIRKLSSNSLRGMRLLRRLYLSDNQIEEVMRLLRNPEEQLYFSTGRSHSRILMIP